MDEKSNQEIVDALQKLEITNVPIAPSQVYLTPKKEVPLMVRVVFRFSGGTIKEQRQAEYVLLGFAVFVFTISLFIFFQGSSTVTSPTEADSFDQLQFTQ